MEEIPNYTPTVAQIERQMRINADCIIKEISDHADKEIARLENKYRELEKRQHMEEFFKETQNLGI